MRKFGKIPAMDVLNATSVDKSHTKCMGYCKFSQLSEYILSFDIG